MLSMAEKFHKGLLVERQWMLNDFWILKVLTHQGVESIPSSQRMMPLHTTKVAKTKQKQNNKCWRVCGETEPFYTAGKSTEYLGIGLVVPQKAKRKGIHRTSDSTPRYTLKNESISTRSLKHYL